MCCSIATLIATSHHVETNADGWPDDVRLLDIEPGFVCPDNATTLVPGVPVEIPNILAFADRVIAIVMRPHDDTQRPPACEKCQREMTLLGRLPQIGIREAVCVYRCLPCQRIATTHD